MPPAPHPSKHGTAALRSLAVCGALGFPLLFAFGLGVVVWACGLVSAAGSGVAGLMFDRDRTRASIALGLVAAIVLGLWRNGAR